MLIQHEISQKDLFSVSAFKQLSCMDCVFDRRCSRSRNSLSRRNRKAWERQPRQQQTHFLSGMKWMNLDLNLVFYEDQDFDCSHVCLPLSLAVKQEDHDALLVEVQRLEAELFKVRQELQGVVGCTGKCSQLDTLEEMASYHYLQVEPHQVSHLWHCVCLFCSADISPGLISGTERVADSVLWQWWNRRASWVPAPLAVTALRQHTWPEGLAGLTGDEHLEKRVPAARTQSHHDPGWGRIAG